MKFSLPRPRAWYVLAAIFFVGAIVAGCSAMPVLQGNLEDVQADQQAQMEAAESGNMLRTVLFALSAAAGSIGYAARGQRKAEVKSADRERAYDQAPYVGVVDGREVAVTENEVVKAVEALRKEGKV